MRKLHPVALDAIKTWWPSVRPDIEKVKAYDAEKWLPEDVYTYLVTGRAFLHVYLSDNEYTGCLVTRVFDDCNGRCMHIWLSAGKDEVINEYWPLIQEEAKRIGCTYITFVSKRQGWDRVMDKMGLTKQSLYMKELL